MPSGTALARRFAVLLGTIAIGYASAVPAAAAVPTYARNEPAVAVATPSTVFLEARYVGYLRNTASGALVRPEPVVVVRRCSGVVVNPDGYVVTTTVCVQPSREVLLVNALYRLGRTLVQQNELTAERLDGFVAGLRDSSTFTGVKRGTTPTLRLTGQFGAATSGDSAAPAVAGVVTKALPAVDGNVALVRLRRAGLAAIELATAPDLRTGSTVDILGYALDETTDDSATYTARNRTVEVIGRTGTNRTGVAGQIGPDSRGGPAVDAAGRLVALLDTDTSADGEPIRDLIVTANIERLLDQSGVDNRLSEVDRTFRSALNVYFAGRYSQAIERFDDVLTQDPGHVAARAYRQRAQERLRLDGDATENAANWWLYLLSGGGGVLVIGAVSFLQRALGRRLRPAVSGGPDPDAVDAAPKGAGAEPPAREAVTPLDPVPPAATAAPVPSSLEDTVVLALPGTGRTDLPAPSSMDDTVVLNRPEARPPAPAQEPADTDDAVRATPADAAPEAPRERPRGAFRPDIEGLRALAVLLVVLWHAGVPYVSGGFVGVDVFFVISGYLITTGMAAEVAARGRLSLGRFWARRAKRLLPSSALVLLAALVLTYLLLPAIRWRDTAWDVVSSALYLVNWRLAEQSVDYLAADQAPSIVQHYWSLAVEEQFYLVWPVLLVGVAWLARRGRAPHSGFRTLALGAVGVVWAASFAWSVLLVETDPGRSYFVTTTRMWELAVGALLALAPLRRLSGAVASAAGWLGVAAIVASAVALDTTTPFPGAMALPATVGAALVIAAGATERYGPVALLRLPPMQFLGGVSYTLYLWHWPLLAVLTARMPDPGLPAVAATVALSVVLAYLTSRLVERPVWHSPQLAVRPRVALAVGAACTVLSVCAGLAFQVATGPAAPDSAAMRNALGAAVLTADDTTSVGVPVDRVPSVVPDPSVARDDLPSVYADRCHASQAERKVLRCAYGARESAVTVAVIGDSHAAQWVPTLRAVVERRNWRLLTYTKSQCPVLDVEVVGGDGQRPNVSCVDWNRDLRARLAADRPNLVVTTSYNYSAYRDGRTLKGAEGRAALVDGMRRTWRSLAQVAPLVVLRDTPAPRLDVAECVSAHREQLTRCAVPRDDALAGIGPLQVDAAKGLTGVRLVDLNDAICPADRCAAVIGGVLVYRDTNHLTATYARTLATRLDEQLQMVMG
ncbi:SGNH hydrolase domain-containing protein [Micromonospora sp. NPDC050200]|uniref:SGNH hydrolase domain-containing protein n=1 Tax=Micromonospora sp. NPDC050200 TaxID=3155664 RepID=UPI00340049CA